SSALSLSREVFSQAVDKLAIKHQQAGIQFLAYIVLVLVVSTVYFKVAYHLNRKI
ncbi:MAG: hypothetical protein ACJAXH_002219, partial [Colwellia sp.]